MRRFIILATLLLGACTTPGGYVDGPSTPVITADDESIIAYIDKRLVEEYYWLDEVVEKEHTFNRRQQWEEYLPSALSKLVSNADDGGYNHNGQRVYYSFIREDESTRTQTQGYGISVYPSILAFSNDELAFVVDYIYPDSPAAKSGLRRGDFIVTVNGTTILRSNYQSLLATLLNGTSSVELTYMRQTVAEDEAKSGRVTLSHFAYEENPVVHSEVIELGDRRVGYLVYTSFDADFEEQLMVALQEFHQAAISDIILDLRCNGGGNVSVAQSLASAILGVGYEGKTLCELRRNPLNKRDASTSVIDLRAEEVSLDMERLVVIGSKYTASASEMIIDGLRGLDVEVVLVGSTTEGKNCGMDVTRVRCGSTTVEYAPITFMCYNAKGRGDYGEGISPDVDLTVENVTGYSDEYYPLPRCIWGDASHDIALFAALNAIMEGDATRAVPFVGGGDKITTAVELPREFIGARYDI